jgi:hypothetical protein
MKQQTAVEWYAIEMAEYLRSIYGDGILNLDILKQAKEMEKEQIIYARNDGFMASGEGWNGEYGIEDFSSLTKEIKSEQYYNETFNTNEE